MEMDMLTGQWGNGIHRLEKQSRMSKSLALYSFLLFPFFFFFFLIRALLW